MDKRQAGVRRYLSDTSMACSTPSAILTPSPSTTTATDTDDQPRNPITARGTAESCPWHHAYGGWALYCA